MSLGREEATYEITVCSSFTMMGSNTELIWSIALIVHMRSEETLDVMTYEKKDSTALRVNHRNVAF
jgi:hypothetical protein